MLHALAVKLLFQEARVLDTDGRDRSQRCQYLQMIFRELGLGNRRIGVDDAEDFSPTPKGTASTERMPCKVIVELIKRGRAARPK